MDVLLLAATLKSYEGNNEVHYADLAHNVLHMSAMKVRMMGVMKPL